MSRERTDLGEACFKAPPLGAVAPLIGTAGSYAMFMNLVPDQSWYWQIGCITILLLLFCPVLWLLWGRRYQRLWVRGYMQSMLILGLIYTFGGPFFLYPILFIIPASCIRAGVLALVALLFVYITWNVIQSGRQSLDKIGFPDQVFVDQRDVFTFDLGNLAKWKSGKNIVRANTLQVYLTIAVAPLAPAAGVIVPLDQGTPWGLLVFPVMAEFAVAWIWTKLLPVVFLFFLYPLYLEFKTGKPVIEVGSAIPHATHQADSES